MGKLLSERYLDNLLAFCNKGDIKIYGEICRLEGELSGVPITSELRIKKICDKLDKYAKDFKLEKHE